MGRKSDEAVARDFQSVLERIQLGETERAFVERRVSAPRRIENRGWRPERRSGVAERRSGMERHLFASGGFGASGAPAGGSVPHAVQQVVAAIQGLRTQLAPPPASMTLDQRFAVDFLASNSVKDALAPEAESVVTHLRAQVRGEAAQRVVIEAGNGQVTNVGKDVSVAVRVMDAFAPVNGATVRFKEASSQWTAQTGENGVAITTWKVKTVGAQTLSAELLSAADSTGSRKVLGTPVEFTAFGV